MIKSIYLFRDTEEERYNVFEERILQKAKAVIGSIILEQLHLTLTVTPPPRFSVIPFRKQKVAAVSVYQTSFHFLEELLQTQGFSGAYRVEEALPVTYDPDWEDETATPGVCLLTLFRQKGGIDFDTFIQRWHQGHTPLSLKIHPIWHYNRNVVTEQLTSQGIFYDGIVEEHFRRRSDLLNPARFFGSPLTMPYRMLQVYLDTISFLDYGSIEPYLVREYRLKSQ